LKLPNFIIAGGVATGTSFLSHAIQHHSDIYLPKIMRPECGFFYKSWEYEKGLSYYSQRWFQDVQNETAIGERSSLYLHGDFLDVAQRIRANLPDTKLIFCLRNPTERAHANYRFSVLSGFEKLSFEDALSEEDRRFRKAKGWKREIQPNLYRRRGDYKLQLQPFLQLFPKSQIHFIKSESLSKNTELEIKKLYDFLGIGYEPFRDVPSFPSLSVKSNTFQILLRKAVGNKMNVLTENSRHGLKEDSVLEKILRMNLMEVKLPMSSSIRTELNLFYEGSNSFVKELTGWDVSDWS